MKSNPGEAFIRSSKVLRHLLSQEAADIHALFEAKRNLLLEKD